MPYPAYQYPNYQIPQPQVQMPIQMQQPMQMPVFNQPMQQNNLSGISGKIVDSIEVVKATDIPVDGSSHYFPKADNSEIYVKRWLANGTTEVVTYKVVKDEPVVEEPKVDFNAMENNIMDRLDELNERIEKIQKGLIPRNNNRKEQQ